MALHCSALVRDGDQQIGLLREAVSVLERSPARYELARALTDLGAAVRRAAHPSEAREELAASGVRRLKRVMLTGVDSLTPSERRVCEMAAGGLANKQIAQALFLTIKTIEMHLGRSYRKLEIRSRAELPPGLRKEA
jgi:DNA-binding CsgD family transcriptional regulator